VNRVAGHKGKEAVDIDPPKEARKGDMLLRGQMLVVEEHDTVFAPKARRISANRVSPGGTARSISEISAPTAMASGVTRI
jgi:hypothetical protein